MNILYATEAVVERGQGGHGRTTDRQLTVELSVPKEIGGVGGAMEIPRPLLCEMTSTLVSLQAW